MIAKRIEAISESPTIKLTEIVKKLKAEGHEIIELNIGEPDLPTPDLIKEAGISAINNNNTKYTINAGTIELRQEICNKLKKENGLDYNINEIIVSNGAKQAIFNAVMCLINPGDEVIIPAPYYVSYPEIVNIAEGKSVIIGGDPANHLKPKSVDIVKAITPKTKMLILCNPNNPTGAVFSKNELEEIAEIVIKNKIYVLIDEIYEKLVYDNKQFISFPAVNKKLKEYTILVNGASKSFAMTGWRMGFAAAQKEIISAMNKLQSQTTSNASTISQHAAFNAYKYQSTQMGYMVNEFEQRRNLFYQELKKNDKLEIQLSQGAFYLFPNVSKYFGTSYNQYKINNSADLCQYILETVKVAMVPGSAFGIEGFIRIAYTIDKVKIKKAAELIQTALSKLI